MTPLRLTGLDRTITLQNETRTEVANDVAIAADLFAIPAELRIAPDAAEVARGERMALWL